MSHTVTFREKRDWKVLPISFGGLLLTAGSAVLLAHFLISIIMILPTTRPDLLDGIFIVLELLLLTAIALVALAGVVFFGVGTIVLLKGFFLLKAAVKVTPDGVWGEIGFPEVDMIPWECIGSVKLEIRGNKPVIAVQTAAWPPYPLWKQCSAAARRLLWQRHNRRQTPLYLYIHTADAPPEVILQAVETGLAHFRSTAAK